MKDVRVDRTALLAALETNRQQHHQLFVAAVDGYREELLRILERHIEDVRAGSAEHVSVFLQRPEDHTPDYDTVIKMLQMSLDEEITLTQGDFRRYVMDQWEWKEAWTASNSAYYAGRTGQA
jgi:hypothetical protein